MSRSPSRRNGGNATTNFGNRQESFGLACPTCETPLAPDHPYLRRLRNSSPLQTKKELERRLARDAEFAGRYLALRALARSGRTAKEIKELSRAIVRDDPQLAAEIEACDDVARSMKVQRRFEKRIRLGLLRYREGRYRGFETELPEKRSPHDRIFASFDTLEWILVYGEMTPQGWRPTAKWLTKTIVAAMLGLKVSALDPYIHDPDSLFPVRIPTARAPILNEACYWTEDVMGWLKMQAAMRDYHEPRD